MIRHVARVSPPARQQASTGSHSTYNFNTLWNIHVDSVSVHTSILHNCTPQKHIRINTPCAAARTTSTSYYSETPAGGFLFVCGRVGGRAPLATLLLAVITLDACESTERSDWSPGPIPPRKLKFADGWWLALLL